MTPHIVLVVFPAQGQFQPALQFAKRLLRRGISVTFATTISTSRRMIRSGKTNGLSNDNQFRFVTFSDGYDDNFDMKDQDPNRYISDFKKHGSTNLKKLIESILDEGRRITCLVSTLFIPWAGEVAREFHLPSALLWLQPASVLAVYCHYFNGYTDLIKTKCKDPSSLMELPGLPPLTVHDLPSFFDPLNKCSFALPTLQEELGALAKQPQPKLLVNSFDALESDAMQAIGGLKPIGVGPLIPASFLGENEFKVDLFGSTRDGYMEWLDSKEEGSAIYISFGTVALLPRPQMEEIARALLDSGLSFLWAMREGEEEKLESFKADFAKEGRGMIVSWCSQVEVLAHRAVGCFVTHCGWNSTLESLLSGKPVVVLPQWSDQMTNAKLIEDLWRTGLRTKANGEGVVEAKELRRCLEMVMGGGADGEGMRRNAEKWKGMGKEAVKEGGSSDKNLKTFVDDVEEVDRGFLGNGFNGPTLPNGSA